METSVVRHASESGTTHAAPADANSDIATVACLSGTGSRTDGDESSFPAPNVNNVVHQRRRVNPESLAARLGPDLVRDLDALITPGNTEMPSFAVRKELQERYNIDRRHIYDYFHSRGLRVVKEDKHGNPITAKDLPTPLPNLRPLRQAPIKSYSCSHPISADRKLFKPRGVTKAKPGRPRKNPPVNPKIVPVICEIDEPKESADIFDPPPSEYSPGAVPTATYITVNPLLPHVPLHPTDGNCAFNSVINPLDESFSVKRAVGDIAYAYRHKLVFERMQELVEHSAKLALAGDRSLSWNVTSPCAASDKGLLVPHAIPLTRDERQAIYESISDSIGPPSGIQECQGTYRKHMQARTKLYFEGILSGPCHRSQQPAKSSTPTERKPPLGTSEFRHWLSETRFLKPDGTNGSPRLLHDHQNVNVVKHQETDSITDKRNRQIPVPNWIQPLEALFPALGRNLNSDDTVADSPVLHTRPVVGQIKVLQPRVDAEIWSAGVAETLQTDHALLHGLSGFPGTQEINLTRVSFGELDHQFHWPEQVPCATSSGQRPAQSDMQGGACNTMSNHARLRLPSHSPCKHHLRDLDRIWTRPVTSRDARRRMPSGAGGI